MIIERLDPAKRWSEATIFNQTLYYTSVPEKQYLDNDAKTQTESALREIDKILARAGSDKSQLLDVTLILADKSDFATMNEVWDAWIIEGKAPVRCTIVAQLMNPRYKIEIKIVAAIPNA